MFKDLILLLELATSHSHTCYNRETLTASQKVHKLLYNVSYTFVLTLVFSEPVKQIKF